MTTKNKTNQKTEQSNISHHTEFKNLVLEGLHSGGIHLVASKNHGKTRLMFSMAQTLRELDNTRVFIFDGSESWIYSFNKIPTFTVSEHDILAAQLKTTDEMEKYKLENFNLAKLALNEHKDLLFRPKTRKPSKRGFFVRTVINYLDQIQRNQKAQNPRHKPQKSIAYFLEEAQDSFNTRSTNRTDTEEFLTVFNESRNNLEAFYTCSQRLTDFSKTIRSKQLYCIGKLNSEDITAFLRRLERSHNLDFANMKPRQWFFEGKTFESPEFRQIGKPRQVNSEVKQIWLDSLPKKKGLRARLQDWLTKQRTQAAQNGKLGEKSETEQNEDLNEDSEFDGEMLGLGSMFPPEDFDSEEE